MLFQTQFTAVFPLGLNAEVTFDTVPVKTPTGLAVFVKLPLLCPENELYFKVT